MKHIYSLNEIVEALHPVFTEFGVKKAVLFGSYATGSATINSDVDLLVDSGLRGMAFYGLLDGVASALTIPVDLIDITQVEVGSPVYNEIRKNGVAIFEQ